MLGQGQWIGYFFAEICFVASSSKDTSNACNSHEQPIHAAGTGEPRGGESHHR
jgi:hypothetical protein